MSRADSRQTKGRPAEAGLQFHPVGDNIRKRRGTDCQTSGPLPLRLDRIDHITTMSTGPRQQSAKIVERNRPELYPETDADKQPARKHYQEAARRSAAYQLAAF